LHVHANAVAAGQFGEAVLMQHATVPADGLWVRAFVLVPSGFAAAPAAILGFEQPSSPYGAVNLQLEAGALSAFTNVAGAQVYWGPAGSVPPNRWVCLEWNVKLAQSGFAKPSVDGVELGALSRIEDTSSTPAASELIIGIAAQAAANIGARDLWIDDLVIDPARTGCTN
jgi:hypothetical protein